jgi:6-phosphogluconolactonase
MGRRAMIAGTVALTATAGMARGSGRSEIQLVVGTYAREGGAGLYPVGYDPASGRWQVGVAVPGAVDASFGVRSRHPGRSYLLEEASAGQVGLWDATHGWRRIARFASMGADPCHAALSADETCLAIANYSSGAVAAYRIDPASGLPVGQATVRTGQGQGPNRDRQSGPHAHWVGFAPDGKWLHSVDLGTDSILSFPFPGGAAAIGDAILGYRAPAGSGPRHLLFDPARPLAYLVSELSNQVTVLQRRADGRFAALQTVSTLPDGFTGASQAAHIAIDRRGRTLYVSNRGHDSIMVYAIDAQGRLTPRQNVATRGSWPRFFLLLDEAKRLVVANERAGELVAFVVADDGRLRALDGVAKVPGAVFLDRA